MSSISSFPSEGYAFSKLVEFKDKDRLEDLINCKRAIRWRRCECKRLANQIKEWNALLDRELFAYLNNPEKLLPTRKIVKRVLEKKTTALIWAKVKNRQIETPSIQKALSRLEELLIRISDLPLHLEQRSYSSLRRTKSDEGLSQLVSQEKEQVIRTKNDTEVLELKLLAEKFLYLHPRYIKRWEKELIEEFKKLKTFKEIRVVTKKLDYLQASILLQKVFLELKYNAKLPYFLCSLSVENLEKLVLSLADQQIHYINRILRKQPEDVIDWIDDQFEVLRQKFIKQYNRKRDAVDHLAKIFRDLQKVHELDASQLRDIETLHGDILNHQIAVNRVRTLIHDVFFNPETRDDLWCVQDEYKKLCARLSDKVEDVERCKSSLYATVYRKVFEANAVADDEPAYEIFGGWRIYRPDDYREVGLLNSISEKEFDELKQNPSTIYKLAAAYLASLGISTIKDWKRLKIFNRQMLKTYLANK